MRIVKTDIFEENGIKYQIDTYNNGTTIKTPYHEPEPEPSDEPEPQEEPSEV